MPKKIKNSEFSIFHHFKAKSFQQESKLCGSHAQIVQIRIIKAQR